MSQVKENIQLGCFLREAVHRNTVSNIPEKVITGL